MKKQILVMFGLLLNVSLLQAQMPYTCVTKGARLDYATYNDEDKLEGYIRETIKEVSDLSNGSYDLRVENTTIKKPGQKKSGDDPYITVIEIREGCVQACPMTMEGTANIIEGREVVLLPSKLAVGYQLPIGDVRIDMGGMVAVPTLTENEIIGREEVTTAAGTFKCYVLRQTLAAKMMGMGMTTTTKTWYSRGVGVVKTETMVAGRLLSRKELVACKM